KTDGETAGIIQYMDIKENTIEVRGKLTTFLLEERIILDTSYIRNIEADMRNIITNNAITNRTIRNLILGPVNNVPDTTEKQVTHDTITQCLIDLGIGFKMKFDKINQKHIFEMYKGLDLSEDICFSEEFENIYDNEITFDDSEYKNFAYVYGEGEGPARIMVTVDLRVGNEELKEMYVDAKDLQREDGVTDEQYKELLRTRGKEKLAEKIKEQSFKCKIVPNGVYVYKKDYNLGDIVICKSIRNKVKFKVRIMSIEEVYDNSGYSLVAEIGDLKEVYYE
ncbi:MAG: siphovirus ReqiPepy6 Gp37-like family protein, partial [Cetobacterium sp.]